MSFAYRCETCSGQSHWTLTRVGDVVTSWACNAHLAAVLAGLQRDHEVTEIVVRDSAKAHEWASISRALDAITKEEPT